MTPVQTRANGLVIPPLPQLLLTAVLHVLVELVLHVVSNLRMNSRRPAECHSDATPTVLPVMTNDTQQEAQIRDRRAPARQSTRSVEINAAQPSPFVSRAPHAIYLPLLRMGRQAHRRLRLRGIASTAEGGGGGLRALARKTEGESPAHRPLTAPA